MAKAKVERRGYVRRLSMRVQEGVDETMKAWRTQARRPDRIGELSHRGLELLHGGLGFAARSLSRMERSTAPPHRPAGHGASTPAPEPRVHAAGSRPRRRPAASRSATARRRTEASAS